MKLTILLLSAVLIPDIFASTKTIPLKISIEMSDSTVRSEKGVVFSPDIPLDIDFGSSQLHVAKMLKEEDKPQLFSFRFKTKGSTVEKNFELDGKKEIYLDLSEIKKSLVLEVR